MTTCLKLGLHPNWFPGSTDELGKEATLCESNPQKHKESRLTGAFIVLVYIIYTVMNSTS